MQIDKNSTQDNNNKAFFIIFHSLQIEIPTLREIFFYINDFIGSSKELELDVLSSILVKK